MKGDKRPPTGIVNLKVVVVNASTERDLELCCDDYAWPSVCS